MLLIDAAVRKCAMGFCSICGGVGVELWRIHPAQNDARCHLLYKLYRDNLKRVRRPKHVLRRTVTTAATYKSRKLDSDAFNIARSCRRSTENIARIFQGLTGCLHWLREDQEIHWRLTHQTSTSGYLKDVTWSVGVACRIADRGSRRVK